MEIDFLGLNSPKYKSDQENPKNPYVETGGGVEVSLSLSTSSSLNFSEKNKWEFTGGQKTEQPSLPLVAPPLLRHPAGGGGFLYDLNDAAAVNLRMPPASLTMLYPTRPNVFTQPQKPQNSVYIPGNASTGLTTSGYTPTVAMARRATLARFLEKRLHRMNQGRASHLMGRSEVGETTITRNSKKKNNVKRT